MLDHQSAISVLDLILVCSISLAICANAKPIAERLGVIDHPNDTRKRHRAPTPQVGGLAIMSSLALWLTYEMFVGKGLQMSFLEAVLLGATPVAVIGFADDQSDISPLARMALLVLMLTIAFFIDPSLTARTLNWGSFQPTAVSPYFYYALMGIGCVGVVNAVNMADGQNGIVASMFVIWSACLALVSGPTVLSISIVLFVASAVVLIYNLRGKLFLGDCGTYGVTFVIGLMAAHAHALGHVSLEMVMVWFFIPVMDCLRLLITRPLRGKSPFDGDRDHFHHRLEDKLGKNFGLLTYSGAVGVTSLTATLEPRLALVCLTVLAAFYFSFAWLTDNLEVAAKGEHEDDAKDLRAAGDNVIPIHGSEAFDQGQRSAG